MKRCDSIGCRNLPSKVLNVSFFDVEKHDADFPMPGMIQVLNVGMPVACIETSGSSRIRKCCQRY